MPRHNIYSLMSLIGNSAISQLYLFKIPPVVERSEDNSELRKCGKTKILEHNDFTQKA